MSRVTLIMGGTFLVIAATLAVTITLRPHPREQFAEESQPHHARASLPVIPHASEPSLATTLKPELNHQTPPRHGTTLATLSTQPPQAPGKSQSPMQTPPREYSVNIPKDHPAASRLAPMARLVQTHANRNLDRLTQQLDLTSEQREKLFPILARSSESYDPAMVILDAKPSEPPLTTDAGELAVDEVLNSEQREQRIDTAITDLLIWQEIISGLERQLAEESPQILPATIPPKETTEASSEPSTHPPGSRPRGNIFNSTPPNP